MMLAGLCAAMIGAAPLSPADAKSYRSDVSFVVQTAERLHPAPFAHADKAAFDRDATAIEKDAPAAVLAAQSPNSWRLIAEPQ